MKKSVVSFIITCLFIAYSFYALAKPLPPRWTLSVNVETDIFLTWEMPQKAVSTIVYRKKKGEVEFEAITKDALGFFMDKGVPEGIWIYKLQAVDSSGTPGEFSSERIIVAKGKKELSYTPPVWGESYTSEDSILLRWRDTCDVPVVAYNLYKKNMGEKEFKLIASESGIKSYKDTSVSLGQKYVYKICPQGSDLGELACSLPIEFEVKKTSQKRDKRLSHAFMVRKTIHDKYLQLSDGMSFYSPTDIKIDKTGKIYVADTGSGMIYIFKYSGKYERSVGIVYLEDGTIEKFDNLLGIDVDDEGNIYGVDSYKGVLKAFDQKGALVLKIVLDEVFEKYKKYSFKKYGLVDVSIDNERGMIYLVDNYNNHIFKFDKKGLLLGVYLSKGQRNGQVHMPTFSYVDGKGNVLLADTLNQKISVFNSKMEPEFEFGLDGNVLGTFIRPKGIAIDNKGDIFVADSFTNTIQVFSPKGVFKYVLGDKKGKQPDIATPNGIFVDKRDKIYIVEKLINRIQVRQLTDKIIKFVQYKNIKPRKRKAPGGINK